jgi:hypothetical protein
MAEQLSPTELLLHIQTVEEVTEKLGHFYTKEQLVRSLSSLVFAQKNRL